MSYLFSHLKQRDVSVFSRFKGPSFINSKSIGGLSNYREMLKPAFEVLLQNDKYKN